MTLVSSSDEEEARSRFLEGEEEEEGGAMFEGRMKRLTCKAADEEEGSGQSEF